MKLVFIKVLFSLRYTTIFIHLNVVIIYKKNFQLIWLLFATQIAIIKLYLEKFPCAGHLDSSTDGAFDDFGHLQFLLVGPPLDPVNVVSVFLEKEGTLELVVADRTFVMADLSLSIVLQIGWHLDAEFALVGDLLVELERLFGLEALLAGQTFCSLRFDGFEGILADSVGSKFSQGFFDIVQLDFFASNRRLLVAQNSDHFVAVNVDWQNDSTEVCLEDWLKLLDLKLVVSVQN